MKRLISKTYDKMKDRGWDKCYWAIDVHDTILKSNYSTAIPTEFFPHAKEALQLLSQRPDAVLILYTSSHDHHVEQYLDFFLVHDIKFDYVNCNPDVDDTPYGCFDRKFYMNIMLEDKAGFDGDRHWKEIIDALSELPSLS